MCHAIDNASVGQCRSFVQAILIPGNIRALLTGKIEIRTSYSTLALKYLGASGADWIKRRCEKEGCTDYKDFAPSLHGLSSLLLPRNRLPNASFLVPAYNILLNPTHWPENTRSQYAQRSCHQLPQQ